MRPLILPAYLLYLLTACDSPLAYDPESVSPSAPSPVVELPRTLTGFPEPTGPARVYSLVSEDASGYDWGADEPTDSQYHLYGNGAFQAIWLDGPFVTNGSYVDRGGHLELRWEQNSVMPPEHPYPAHWKPWEAVATLVGDTLSVDYPSHMWHAGFLDAVYVLTP